jgi:chromosome segregation ATPase
VSVIAIERTPNLIAAEINDIKGQTRTMILYSSIEIGRRLVEAKAMIDHGEWGNWLEQSVDYSKSTANNLMKIFEEYGTDRTNLLGHTSNLQALGDLSYTQAVALLGIPRDEREHFVEDHDLESLSTRELQKAIKEKQELERQLAEAEAGLREKVRQEQLFEEKLTEAEQQTNLAVKQAQSADRAIKAKEHDIDLLHERITGLTERLETAQAAGNDDEVATLREQLAEANKDLTTSADRIDELEAQLKAKPIETTATTVEERIPEDVQKELAELRKQSPAVVRFRAHFDALVSGFQKLLEDLAEMQGLDHDKYRGAVSGLIGKMSERL